jgi:hypothetical protein
MQVDIPFLVHQFESQRHDSKIITRGDHI